MAARPLTVGVGKETAPGERRVAVVPETVPRLRDLGVRVLVETGAGSGAGYSDSDYSDSGAEIATSAALLERCGLLVSVTRPDTEVLRGLTADQSVAGLLRPREEPTLFAGLAAEGVTAISLDRLPRTLSRAQSMDALTSQANVAGYKSVLVAAASYDRYFPMLMTAAGVAKPARVLVLGAGVAGLQAIATARRLGAQVSGYDVRPAAREEIASLGAGVLELPQVGPSEEEGGYARGLSGGEGAAQRAALAERIGSFDVVITTAQVAGARPPLLLGADALARLRPGAVVVDLAAGELGGNVEGSRPEESRITENGVTVIGAGNLPATVPRASSEAYARNIVALLGHLAPQGSLDIDLDDEISSAVVLTHGGRIVDDTLAEAAERPVPTGGAGLEPGTA